MQLDGILHGCGVYFLHKSWTKIECHPALFAEAWCVFKVINVHASIMCMHATKADGLIGMTSRKVMMWSTAW
eukprot:1139941-Pelagomonas_calceolata.AAC.2